MAKISTSMGNDHCPQTLFLFGTFKDDGTPNFGLFCWFSYYWMEDGLGVMACIGQPKLTLDRIRETKVFSANLVTESMLPLADYFGCVNGHAPEKMSVDFAWEKGAVLDVPTLADSPVSFELEVDRLIDLDEKGSTLILAKIRNTLRDERLVQENLTLEEKLRQIAPVSTTGSTYFGWQGNAIAGWGEPGSAIAKK